MTDEAQGFTTTAANAPSLTYASSDGRTITAVDRMAVRDQRERAICRALLQFALALLDAEDASPHITPA